MRAAPVRDGLNIVIDAVDGRNVLDAGTSHEFLVAKLNPGVDPTKDITYADFQVLSQIKYPDACITPGCVYPRADLCLTPSLPDCVEIAQSVCLGFSPEW